MTSEVLYPVGTPVEVVRNTMDVLRLGAAPQWIETRIEEPRGTFPNRNFVRVDGVLVTRSAPFIRRLKEEA